MIEVLEHTADVRLRITASSMEELFRDALRGTIELLRPKVGPRTVRRAIEVTAPDPTVLLIDFLNEALSSAHVHREAYDDAAIGLTGDNRVAAELRGHEALGFGEDVKAVTYHEAEIRRDADGRWSVTIVYDI